jgi:hypothetical protein
MERPQQRCSRFLAAMEDVAFVGGLFYFFSKITLKIANEMYVIITIKIQPQKDDGSISLCHK